MNQVDKLLTWEMRLPVDEVTVDKEYYNQLIEFEFTSKMSEFQLLVYKVEIQIPW